MEIYSIWIYLFIVNRIKMRARFHNIGNYQRKYPFILNNLSEKFTKFVNVY